MGKRDTNHYSILKEKTMPSLDIKFDIDTQLDADQVVFQYMGDEEEPAEFIRGTHWLKLDEEMQSWYEPTKDSVLNLLKNQMFIIFVN